MNMKRIIFIAVVLELLLVSCGNKVVPDIDIIDNDENVSIPEEESKKEEPNERVDFVLSSDQRSMAAAGNAFALKLFNDIIAEHNKDIIISPLSVEFALGMLNEGAREETSKEIIAALSFDGQEHGSVNEYYKSFIDQSISVDNQVDLIIANALVVSDNYDILDSYLSELSKYYYAEHFILDYDEVDEVAVVNDWVESHTGGQIPNFVDRIDDVNLLNTILFNARWDEPFDDKSTKLMPFYDAAGRELSVYMMQNKSSCRYLDGDIFNMVCKSYSNGAYRFIVLLPDEGYGVDDIATALADNGLQQYVNAGKSEFVDFYLPSFESDFSINMRESMKRMGISKVFSTGNFSGMVADGELSVNRIFHKARIKLDEVGTCASAATIVQMDGASPGEKEPIIFKADHPFVYAITEISSTKIFFIGAYMGSDL